MSNFEKHPASIAPAIQQSAVSSFRLHSNQHILDSTNSSSSAKCMQRTSSSSPFLLASSALLPSSSPSVARTAKNSQTMVLSAASVSKPSIKNIPTNPKPTNNLCRGRHALQGELLEGEYRGFHPGCSQVSRCSSLFHHDVNKVQGQRQIP